MANMREVQWNKAAFETVVFEDDTKELIKALVTNLTEPSHAADIISGKGNGLVILLHGFVFSERTLKSCL